MSIPSYVGAGATQTLGGTATPAWPAGHAINDIGVMYIKTSSQAIGSTPSGWALVTDSPQTIGAAATAGSVRLTVLWKRATSNAEAALSIGDSGDHQIAQILVFRDGVTTGDPWDVTNGGTDASSTSVSVDGDTTTVADCLILACVANGTETAATQTSGWANSDLTGVAELVDTQAAVNLGGGFSVASGSKAVAGAFGATTATLLTASAQAWHMMALKGAEDPPDAPLTANPPSVSGSSAPRSPSWLASAIKAVTNLADLVKLLAAELPRFAHHVTCYERVTVLVYGTTVRPGGRVTRYQTLRVTDTVAFTMENPADAREGVDITFDIENGSGGTMGAITWGTEYELTATFTNPASTKHRLISFGRSADGKWRERYRSSGDMD
jgi:hypothetical protein